MNEIRSCPGDRVLVLGNHDGNARGLRLLGFTVQHTLALCATDPPLALSHEPLRQIPPGAICVHGHLHEGTEPTVRHINLTVEQTLYRPVTARPGRRAGPRAGVDHQQQPTMKRSRVGAAGAERAAEMRVGLEGDHRALARLRSESAALVSTGSGPGAGRATFSSPAGLTSLWRNGLFEPIAARRQQCRVRLRFAVLGWASGRVAKLQPCAPRRFRLGGPRCEIKPSAWASRWNRISSSSESSKRPPVRFSNAGYQPKVTRPRAPVSAPPSNGLSRRCASTPSSKRRLSVPSTPRP